MKIFSHKTLFFFLSLLMILGWGMLYQLYSFFTYYDYQYFALDKVSGHFFSPIILFTGFILLTLSLIYLILVFIISRIGNIQGKTLFIFILSVFLSSLFGIGMYPVGALDIFNYVLVGKLLLFYKQNPFIIPFDAIGLTDPLHKYAIFLNVTTGYGPLWLLFTCFALFFSGSTSIVSMIVSYKVVTFFIYVLSGYILFILQDDKKKKLLSAALYLLNPFIIFEGIVNAHNDILVAFLLLLSWLAFKKKHVTVFVFIVLAGLVKFYAFSLLPLFFFMTIKEKWQRNELVVGTCLAIITLVILYLPFWDHGNLISGVYTGMQNAQAINGFSPFSLVREYLVSQNASLYTIAITQIIFMGLFLSLLSVSLFYLRKINAYRYLLIAILLAFLLCISIFQPWYLIPVIAFLSLSTAKRDILFSFSISTGALLSYIMSLWGWFHSGWSTLSIHFLLSFFIVLPGCVYLIYLLVSFFPTRSKAQDWL